MNDESKKVDLKDFAEDVSKANMEKLREAIVATQDEVQNTDSISHFAEDVSKADIEKLTEAMVAAQNTDSQQVDEDIKRK